MHIPRLLALMVIFISRSMTCLKYAPIPPTFSVDNIGESSFNVSWTPATTGNPGSVFFVQYRTSGAVNWKTTNSENAVQRWKVVSGLLPGTIYHVRMLVRDANNRNDRTSPFETITTTGVAAVADITTAGWFVGLMILLALLVLALVIICIVKRSRNGGKYPVHEKERLRSETGENGGYVDQGVNGRTRVPLTRPGIGSQDSVMKHPNESCDSLAEYTDTENCRFNEEGSFIGQYGRRTDPSDIRTHKPLSTFV